MCQVRDYDLESVTADILYNSIHVSKSKRKREEGNVAYMWERGGAYRIMEGDYLKDAGVDGRKILKWIIEKRDWGGRGMDWIDLAWDRDRWWALVNVVINFRVS
jgi:hypothetical protein